MVVDARQCEWKAPGRVGGGFQPIAQARHHGVVRGTDQVEDAEDHLGVDGLAVRAALVRFEGVAEAPVAVAVRAQGIQHRLPRRVLEQAGEESPIQRAGVAHYEVPRMGEQISVPKRSHALSVHRAPELNPWRANSNSICGLASCRGS
ncbi:MAG: hypothetical protein OXK76_19050 [Gammaproteobacteria bacterium]|nr:hypothetical protein [Gammaproteobacteria bacterium]